MSDAEKTAGLTKLREAFPEHQIGKLAKGSKAQTQCQASEKVNCAVCGGWHHPKMIHLDFVGHAALTDRLLDADLDWTWEPLAFREGLPAFDENGGLWIKLTVRGVTRLGYGNAQESEYKEVGSREKEVIGDALRNAAMRFGAALELWHKGDLHLAGGEPQKTTTKAPNGSGAQAKEDAYWSLSQEVRNGLDKAKVIVSEYFEAGDVPGAKNYLEGLGLENDEKLGLWHILPSDQRSALKK